MYTLDYEKGPTSEGEEDIKHTNRRSDEEQSWKKISIWTVQASTNLHLCVRSGRKVSALPRNLNVCFEIRQRRDRVDLLCATGDPSLSTVLYGDCRWPLTARTESLRNSRFRTFEHQRVGLCSYGRWNITLIHPKKSFCSLKHAKLQIRVFNLHASIRLKLTEQGKV